MFPDPADLAAARDAFLERQHRLWLADNRGRIEKLAAALREAYSLSRKVWSSDKDEAPAAILNALYTVESELED
jgi:hypothetical protein